MQWKHCTAAKMFPVAFARWQHVLKKITKPDFWFSLQCC